MRCFEMVRTVVVCFCILKRFIESLGFLSVVGLLFRFVLISSCCNPSLSDAFM